MFKKILKIFLVTLLLLLLFELLFLLIKYISNDNPNKTFLFPRIEKIIVEIDTISQEKITYLANVLLYNPLPITYRADSFEYKLYLSDVQVLKNTYRSSLRITAGDSSRISLPVTLYKHNLDSIIKVNDEQKNDTVPYRIESSFYTKIPFIQKFTIDQTRMLPLFHFPSLEAKHIEVDSINFSRAVINVQTNFINQNVFEIEVKNIYYEFQIEDNGWITGKINGRHILRAKGKTELNIPLHVEFKQVAKTVVDLLRKGKNVQFSLRLSLLLDPDNKMLKESKVLVETSGNSLKSLLKTVKNE